MAAAADIAAADRAALKASLEAELASAHAAHAKQTAEGLVAEREKRAAHLQHSAARRMANRYIMMGFTTWQGQWEEAARQKRVLAAAGGRLARPALAAAVAHWVGEWRFSEVNLAAGDVARQKGELLSRAATDQADLKRQIGQMRAEMARDAAAAAAELQGVRAAAAVSEQRWRQESTAQVRQDRRGAWWEHGGVQLLCIACAVSQGFS